MNSTDYMSKTVRTLNHHHQRCQTPSDIIFFMTIPMAELKRNTVECGDDAALDHVVYVAVSKDLCEAAGLYSLCLSLD